MKDDQRFMFPLLGDFHSGLGVQVRTLSREEHDEVIIQRNLNLPDDPDNEDERRTAIEARVEANRFGAKRFICAVTTKPLREFKDKHGKRVKSVVAVPKEGWRRLSLQDLSVPSSDYAFEKLFTVKDESVLFELFRSFHEPSQAEVEAAKGKLVPVSGD